MAALRRPSRGVALLMVLALVALLGSVAADFLYTSRIEAELAFGARDALQAEYNALSALRMRALLLKQVRKVQQAAKLFPGMEQMPVGQLIDMIPVECGLMNAITKRVSTVERAGTGGKGGHDDKGGADDFFLGECMAASESEHAKIPINLLRAHIQDRATTVAMMLVGVLSDPRLKKYFEAEDEAGGRAETPQLLTQSITDWIDSDHSEALNLGDEDRHYQALRDPYRAKNAPFDSVAELQLVYGMSDALYERLLGQVTIYKDNPAIELNSASIDTILRFLPAVLKDGVTLDMVAPAWPSLVMRLRVVRSMSSTIPFSISIFKQLCQQSGIGQLIDDAKIGKVFSDASSTTWYTLMAEGRMGKATRRVRAVFQASEGQFYYARFD
jgi:general secretion pathway protein K